MNRASQELNFPTNSAQRGTQHKKETKDEKGHPNTEVTERLRGGETCCTVGKTSARGHGRRRWPPWNASRKPCASNNRSSPRSDPHCIPPPDTSAADGRRRRRRRRPPSPSSAASPGTRTATRWSPPAWPGRPGPRRRSGFRGRRC